MLKSMSLRDYIALQDRDRTSYRHGDTGSYHTVKVIVLEAGHEQPTMIEVGLAYLTIGRDCTVGELAELVIARRTDGAQRLFTP